MGTSRKPGEGRKADRQAKLAEALRDNLKRRKAQARQRKQTGPAKPGTPDKN